MFENREGISTFIATLLLMVLAVSAGVVIYAYTMGYMGGFGGTDTLGAMSLDEGTMWSNSDIESTSANDRDNVTAYIRNIGKSTVELDTVYVDGKECTIQGVVSIQEGQVEKVVIFTENDGEEPPDYLNDWKSGMSYDIKIIAKDNTQITFSLKCK